MKSGSLDRTLKKFISMEVIVFFLQLFGLFVYRRRGLKKRVKVCPYLCCWAVFLWNVKSYRSVLFLVGSEYIKENTTHGHIEYLCYKFANIFNLLFPIYFLFRNPKIKSIVRFEAKIRAMETEKSSFKLFHFKGIALCVALTVFFPGWELVEALQRPKEVVTVLKDKFITVLQNVTWILPIVLFRYCCQMVADSVAQSANIVQGSEALARKLPTTANRILLFRQLSRMANSLIDVGL